MAVKPDLRQSPPRPDPQRIAQMRQLADWHRRWVAKRLNRAPFIPRGEGSDYNLHYVDIEADNDEFHDRAREIFDVDDGEEPPVTPPAVRDRTLHLLTPAQGPGTCDDARAAGQDVTPGRDELHHYWTRGEGLAKWKFSPRPWTTLVALLTRHVGPRKAKVFASRWFHEVFGFYAGSDLNRVTHGKPPRGKLIGPG